MKLFEKGGVAPVALIALVGLALACERPAEERPMEVRPTPRPQFPAAAIETISREEIVAYARTLEFDTRELAGDKQRLFLRMEFDKVMQESVAVHGPLVEIHPEVGSYRLGRDSLSEGRIIARLVNLDPIPYPSLALGPQGTSYFWVDQIANDSGRALLISSDPDVKLVKGKVRLHKHDQEWRQALARWWSGSTEVPWSTCDRYTCCRPVELQ